MRHPHKKMANENNILETKRTCHCQVIEHTNLFSCLTLTKKRKTTTLQPEHDRMGKTQISNKKTLGF